eukprot:5232423-Prymnesium_polylepis.1
MVLAPRPNSDDEGVYRSQVSAQERSSPVAAGAHPSFSLPLAPWSDGSSHTSHKSHTGVKTLGRLARHPSYVGAPIWGLACVLVPV